MNKSQLIIKRSIKVFEAAKKFKIKEPTMGVSFVKNKPIKIPVGTYTIIEPDDRDRKRVIIANVANQELYAIKKELAK